MSNTNQASSTLASTITDTARTLSVQSGAGVNFPPTPPYTLVVGNPDGINERMKATAKASDAFTVFRGIDQTAQRTWPAGTPVAFAFEPGDGDPWGVSSRLGVPQMTTNTAQALSSNGTIATANLGVSKISAAGNVTGIILQAGTADGQMCMVINTSTHTITFAASNSNVADGSSDVIAASTARGYMWEATGALWYRLG